MRVYMSPVAASLGQVVRANNQNQKIHNLDVNNQTFQGGLSSAAKAANYSPLEVFWKSFFGVKGVVHEEPEISSKIMKTYKQVMSLARQSRGVVHEEPEISSKIGGAVRHGDIEISSNISI